jgi:predicted ATPase/class 3 adenylate cyclase
VGEFPSGTVTFLFTDLEGSTRRWQEHPEAMKPALARHDEIVRHAIESRDGYVVKTTGDGFLAAFAVAHDAIDAAIAAQRALTDEPWPEIGPLLARMGLHSGPAELREGDYHGTTLNRAARLMAAAHGGQIVASLATVALVHDEGIELLDLGQHALRDLARPERVFQVVSRGLARDFPRLRSLDAFPGNLPAQLTSFVGRDVELAATAKSLETARLVTLTGVGGVGKTRLSLQVAAEVLPRFAHGAWFCELATAVDEESLMQVVMTTLGVAPLQGMTLEQSLLEFLRAKSQLLVLDNCEHLLDEVSRIAESILAASSDVRILASSREGLGIPGEQIVAVRSLPMPDPDRDFRAVLENASVQLFTERAAAVRSGFTLDAANAVAVVEICRRLDGIPLAIELAAARVSAMNPSDISAHLDERFRLLAGARRSGIERHQTLRATVDWSYSLLEPTEQAVFDRLGVFAGDFGAEAAQAVATGAGIEPWDVIDALSGLVAKSMINIDDSADGEARYRMLETLRAYARERLDDLGASDQWRFRHAQHYAEVAEVLGPQLLSRDEFAARRRFRVELDNTRAAVTWALDADDPSAQELGVRIVLALGYEVTMDRRAGIGLWAEHALRRVDEWQPASRIGVLSVAAHSACGRADLLKASEWIDEAFGLGPSADGPAALLLWVARSVVVLANGEFDEAMQGMAAAIEFFDSAGGTDFQRSNIRGASAHFRISCGDLSGALVEAEESLALAREVGNPSDLAIALAALGAALYTSDPRRALDSLEECLALTDAGASDVVRPHALVHLAALRAQFGDARGSLECLRDGFERYVEWGDRATLGLLAFGAVPLVATGHPELSLAMATAMTRYSPLGGETHQATQRAVARARDEVGAERANTLVARVETMTYDEVVAYLGAEFDRALASTL